MVAYTKISDSYQYPGILLTFPTNWHHLIRISNSKLQNIQKWTILTKSIFNIFMMEQNLLKITVTKDMPNFQHVVAYLLIMNLKIFISFIVI